MHRLLPSAFLALLLPLAVPAAAEELEPPGWTTTVKRLEGSERRLWHLALVSHESSRHVTLVVAPVSQAGQEGAGGDGERVERSETGDLHQIARWAEQLRKDAEGWKRPSLRDRPSASSHVIGVVRAVTGRATVQNAEHGGGRLAVGDLLFVEDVLACEGDAVLCVELMGKETLWHHRSLEAELAFGSGARVGLRQASDELLVHVHEGTATGTTSADDLRLRTDRTTYAPDVDAAFLLTCKTPERLDVRTGFVVVGSEGAKATVAGGSALAIAEDGSRTVAVLDEARWEKLAPQEPACTRTEALRLVERVRGQWRGQPLNASITLNDDGRWRSYERHTGRSVNKGGAWEPRPGGIVELTYVWTPHRGKTQKTDLYRYLLDGNALVRLRPGGAVFLHKTPGN